MFGSEPRVARFLRLCSATASEPRTGYPHRPKASTQGIAIMLDRVKLAAPMALAAAASSESRRPQPPRDCCCAAPPGPPPFRRHGQKPEVLQGVHCRRPARRVGPLRAGSNLSPLVPPRRLSSCPPNLRLPLTGSGYGTPSRLDSPLITPWSGVCRHNIPLTI